MFITLISLNFYIAFSSPLCNAGFMQNFCFQSINKSFLGQEAGEMGNGFKMKPFVVLSNKNVKNVFLYLRWHAHTKKRTQWITPLFIFGMGSESSILKLQKANIDCDTRRGFYKDSKKKELAWSLLANVLDFQKRTFYTNWLEKRRSFDKAATSKDSGTNYSTPG